MSLTTFSRRDLFLSFPGATAVALLAASKGFGDESPTIPVSAIKPIDLVDPELRPALKAIPSFNFVGDVKREQLAMIRALTVLRPGSLGTNVIERSIPRRGGAPDVKVYIINAKEGDRRPAILHMHGGGYILGKAATEIPRLKTMAQTLGCVIVTVDYRLAPETPFPGSLEDNYAALAWTFNNAETLGVDPARIALTGESAGGGHAAMLALAARDRGEVPVLFQSLVYPMLDDRTGSTRPTPAHIGTILWNSSLNRFGWESLLGVQPGSDVVPAGAVPARVENLAGLPPTWIGTGSLDLFVEENIEYARRLINAGVPTDLTVIPGAYHGFDALVPKSSAGKRFTLSRINALARAFGIAELNSLEKLND